jgi:hypothetical protein
MILALAQLKAGSEILPTHFRQVLLRDHFSSNFHREQGDRGSMLGSQFSAIFANSRRKKVEFFSKSNVMIIFFPQNCSSLSKKRQYFRQNFRRKYF